MRILLRILIRLIFVVIACIAGAIVYSTANGSTTWYFRVNGSVRIDGQATGGYLHANTQRTVLLVTRTDEERPETYLVQMANRNTILDCGQWHPVHFLPNPVGDLNSRCSAPNVKFADVEDAHASAALVRTARSIEFRTSSGKKVKAEW